MCDHMYIHVYIYIYIFTYIYTYKYESMMYQDRIRFFLLSRPAGTFFCLARPGPASHMGVPHDTPLLIGESHMRLA